MPAPNRGMFGRQTRLNPTRSADERATDHPVMQGLLCAPVAQAFGCDDICKMVRGASMGPYRQRDDQMGGCSTV